MFGELNWWIYYLYITLFSVRKVEHCYIYLDLYLCFVLRRYVKTHANCFYKLDE